MLKRAALTALAVLITARLALGPFRQGWSEMHTDFPNHYVGAILALDHQPLKQWYDWEFFQRHIDYAGIHQLGAYVPHPPLVMLPLLPLAKLPPQRAKQVWMLFEVLCLAASVLLLARLAKTGVLLIYVLTLLAYASLATNFLLGHYYIFLLLLLTVAVWCLLRGRELAAGALFGLIFALKLYAAPFALFFLFRRQWKALLGMAATVLVLTGAAIAVFGADPVWYFATSIMPRAGNAEITDPYHPAFGSMSVLLHRLFIQEAELNPHPVIASPPAYFFFQTLFTTGLTVFALLALPRKSEHTDARAIAFWIVLLFALSPFTAFSHYVMLVVPLVLLLSDAPAIPTALYILVQLPERPWNAWMFPRLWFTLALLLYIGWPFLRAIRPRHALAALAAVLAVSLTAAIVRTAPQSGGEHIALRPGALFSSAPALTPTGIVYESMEDTRFGLRTLDRDYQFDGDAFHPSAPASGTPIYFELVSDRRSHIAALDPASGQVNIVADGTEPAVSLDGASLLYVSGENLILQRGPSRQIVATGHISNPTFFPDGQRLAYTTDYRSIRTNDPNRPMIESSADCFEPSISPDGESIAFACSETGAIQVWTMNLGKGTRQRVTTGACNNTWPVWGHDSRTVIYASDCDRGFGLPALYSRRVDTARSAVR